MDKAKFFLGVYGGGGLGYRPGASLVHRSNGTVCVSSQRDGNLFNTTSALWAAANPVVPLLIVMTNNRTYCNDDEHQEKIAIARGRFPEYKVVGMRMERPPVAFANLACSFGISGEGPITEPDKIRPALDGAFNVIQNGHPALVDLIIQTT